MARGIAPPVLVLVLVADPPVAADMVVLIVVVAVLVAVFVALLVVLMVVVIVFVAVLVAPVAVWASNTVIGMAVPAVQLVGPPPMPWLGSP